MDDDNSLPTIRIGRKDWPVQEFVWRETKKLLPMVRHCANINWNNLTDKDMEVLGDMTYFTISRANGGLTREQFDEMPVTLREITEALPTIAKQADLEAKPAGEPQAPPNSGGLT
jgi:hypothetical protein